MTKLDDETLIAYADGALSAADAITVEKLLAGDAEASRLVAALRRSRRLAEEAFGQPMQEAPPAALVDLIMGSPSAVGKIAARGDNVVTTPARRPSRWSSGQAGWLAMAASVSALVAGLSGYTLGHRSAAAASYQIALGQVSASSPTHDLLERRPSGAIVDAGAAQRKLSVIGTFRDREARPCREFEELIGSQRPQPIAAAVACRDSNGSWVVEGASRVASADKSGDLTTKPSGANEKDALASLLTMIGAGKVLPPAEEQKLLSSTWK